MKLHHLPAIVLRAENEKAFTLVAACGKRGAIAVRDAAEEAQMRFLGTVSLCPECLVKWDAAEESSSLRIVWALKGKRAWSGPGAVVFAGLIQEMYAEKNCGNCKGRIFPQWWSPEPIAAVVREDRRPKVGE